MLSALIVNLFKMIFGFLFTKKSDYSESEIKILSKNLNVKNKTDMLERIDFWLTKKEIFEASKLINLYTENNGTDENISKRQLIIKDLINNKN